MAKSPAPTTPAEPSAPAAVPAMELGTTGLKRQSGYVFEEYHPKLKGDKALQAYEEMETSSPVIGAALLAIDLLARQVEWRVDPGKDLEEDPRAEFVWDCLTQMRQPWTDTLSEILTMVPYGFAYHEIVYRQRPEDGQIGWAAFAHRAQVTRDRWEFNRDGTIKGMWQVAAPDYQRVFLPIEKSLLFRPSAHKNNPEGRSALRRAYRPWYFAKRIEEFEGIGIERDLAGLPVVEVPAELTTAAAGTALADTYERFKKLVRNIRRDEQEGVILPQQYDQNGNPMYKLTLLSTGSRRQFDTTEILTRYDTKILWTLLADFIALGHEKVGSFALASSKTNLFSVAMGAWLDTIAETINRHAIPRLLALNGMATEDPPRLCHGDIETPDLTELADYITKLTTAGMPIFPDRKVENQLRGYAKFPPLTDEEFRAREAQLAEQRAAELEAMQAGMAEAEQAKTDAAAVAKRADHEAAEVAQANDADRLARFAAALRPPPANVHVDVAAPVTHVTVPAQKAPKPPVVNVEAPVVHVAPSPAPVVHVAPPAVQVTVEGAKPGSAMTMKRDAHGKLERIESGQTIKVVRDAKGKIARLERGES